MVARIVELAVYRAERTLAQQEQVERTARANETTRFHLWPGASGRRYIHSVYGLIECPPMPTVNYVLVRHTAHGAPRRCRSAVSITALPRSTSPTCASVAPSSAPTRCTCTCSPTTPRSARSSSSICAPARSRPTSHAWPAARQLRPGAQLQLDRLNPSRCSARAVEKPPRIFGLEPPCTRRSVQTPAPSLPHTPAHALVVAARRIACRPAPAAAPTRARECRGPADGARC